MKFRSRVDLVLVGAALFLGLALTAVSHIPNPGRATADAPEEEPAGFPVHWSRPGAFFPVLGWRDPVALSASELMADRQLANLDPTAFNCHFYTRFHIRRQRGESVMPRPRQEHLSARCLALYGYHPVTGPMAAGDILTAIRADDAGQERITHSALVLAVDARGQPSRIRQKFDDEHPVVDVTMDEFRTLYAGLHPWRITAWRAQ